MLQVGQHLASGGHPVTANVGEDFFGGWSGSILGFSGLQFVEVNRLETFRIAAKEREEGGVLQEQQAARLVISSGLVSEMESVGAGERVQRNQAGAPHEQFARAIKQAVPNRLRSDAAIEQFSDFIGGLLD